MLLNKVDIEEKIYAFLNGGIFTDVEVVKGRQDDWRDNQDYCVYVVSPFGDECFPRYYLKEDGVGYELITELVQDVDVRIDMLGSSAFDNYEVLKRALFDDEFYEVGLSLKSYINKPTDNTALEKNFWRERATGGFSLRFTNTTSKPISTIDEVNVEYEAI